VIIETINPADGEIWGILSDIHFPHQDQAALNVAIEILESIGIDRVILNGDISDVTCLSDHEKDPDAPKKFEVECRSTEPFLDWVNTRGTNSRWILGNHERRWHRYLFRRTPELYGQEWPLARLFRGKVLDGKLADYPKIRAGNLVTEHGDSFWPRGNITPANPAVNILDKAPDQTTIVGHVHKISYFCRNSYDVDGVRRTHAAHSAGHLSRPDSHSKYVGDYTNWNQSFTVVWFYRVDGAVRFHVLPIEIHRDKRNRPFAMYNGKVYR
jgi:predicted phosphodiesterase